MTSLQQNPRVLVPVDERRCSEDVLRFPGTVAGGEAEASDRRVLPARDVLHHPGHHQVELQYRYQAVFPHVHGGGVGGSRSGQRRGHGV